MTRGASQSRQADHRRRRQRPQKESSNCESDIDRLIIEEKLGQNGLKLLSHLFQHPLVTVNGVSEVVGATFVTANRLIARLEEMNILREITGEEAVKGLSVRALRRSLR